VSLKFRADHCDLGGAEHREFRIGDFAGTRFIRISMRNVEEMRDGWREEMAGLTWNRACYGSSVIIA